MRSPYHIQMEQVPPDPGEMPMDPPYHPPEEPVQPPTTPVGPVTDPPLIPIPSPVTV
jgi:hypothetical protein